MINLASTIIAIITEYLSRGPTLGQRADSAAASLYGLVRDRLPDEGSLRTLAQEASADAPRDRTTQRAELAVEDALESDPSFAARALALVRRAQEDHTTAGGVSSNRHKQQVTQKNLWARGDIRTNVSSRSRNTKVAIGGGGVLLAIAMVFVWFQYSSSKASSEELAGYRQGVISTCDRIRETGTGQLNPNVSADGFSFRRDEMLQLLDKNQKVVQEQIGNLLSRRAPEGLSNERIAVEEAAAAVDAAYPDAVARIEKLPKMISMEDLQSVATEPAMANLTDKYRRLGDALTQLGGSNCAIEAPSATK